MTNRAEFNNNPGNIRPAKGVEYEGLLGTDDKGFGIFESPEMGRKALENDIRHKIKSGHGTPDSFVDRYAPAGNENDEQARVNYKVYLMDQAGLNSTGDKFDDKHIHQLANAITAFEGGGWKIGEPAQSPDYVKVDSGQPKDGDKVTSSDAGTLKSSERDADRKGLTILGGVAGAGTGTSLLAAEKGLELASRLKDRFTGGSPAGAVKDLAEHALSASGGHSATPSPLLPPAQGAAAAKDTGTYKYGVKFGLTNTEAARAVDMSKGEGGVWDLVKKAEEATKKIGPGYTSIPERSDILLDTSAGSGPRGGSKTFIPGVTSGPKVGLPPNPFPSPLTGAANAIGEFASKAAPYVAPAAKVAVSGLGGIAAANQLYDAAKEYKKEPGQVPSLRTSAKALSGLGGVAAMAPFGVTQVGGALAQIPEVAIQAHDWYRRAKKRATPESVEQMLTNVDPMGNPLP